MRIDALALRGHVVSNPPVTTRPEPAVIDIMYYRPEYIYPFASAIDTDLPPPKKLVYSLSSIRALRLD
jgi:hypothetical protein